MLAYIKEVTQEKGSHDSSILNIVNTEDRSCLICGSRNANSRKIQFNRKHGRGNIVTFNVCTNCLKELRRSFINLKL